MAHEAYLFIDNKNDDPYLVMECSYTLTQEMQRDTAQPAEKPKPGVITFTVVAPDDADMFFHDWMQKPNEKKSGWIYMKVVSKGSSSDRYIRFEDAFCVSLYEYFNMHSSDQMYTRLSIFPARIIFGEEANAVLFDVKEKTINNSSGEKPSTGQRPDIPEKANTENTK
ncbi:MAG: hypothetical protein FWF70_08255 [Bacteroidetes bacterium]|nr:hypothetical protein [Bacteroidota bacterium]MCL1968244.1 hypothetical protein [Bacteroidota bacterium]